MKYLICGCKPYTRQILLSQYYIYIDFHCFSYVFHVHVSLQRARLGIALSGSLYAFKSLQKVIALHPTLSEKYLGTILTESIPISIRYEDHLLCTNQIYSNMFLQHFCYIKSLNGSSKLIHLLTHGLSSRVADHQQGNQCHCLKT